MKLINENKLLELLEEKQNISKPVSCLLIKMATIGDVERGYWKEESDTRKGKYCCSVCGKTHNPYKPYVEEKFCPYCGSRMIELTTI